MHSVFEFFKKNNQEHGLSIIPAQHSLVFFHQTGDSQNVTLEFKELGQFVQMIPLTLSHEEAKALSRHMLKIFLNQIETKLN